MAVIPFISTGKENQTIVQKKEDFDKDGNKVLILNADDEQLKNFNAGTLISSCFAHITVEGPVIPCFSRKEKRRFSFLE